MAEKITQLALGGGRANPRTGVIVVHWCYVEGGRGLRVMLTFWSSSHMRKGHSFIKTRLDIRKKMVDMKGTDVL